MVGLDGYDPALAGQLMQNGEMPNMARLAAESAVAELDHGDHRLTGLSWEHFATGLKPDAGGRWAAVSIDPANYRIGQPTTTTMPFLGALPRQAVVFDPPYFDLGQAPNVRGAVNWGAHDPGVSATSRPIELQEEIFERFGAYPAKPFIYGFLWPDEARTRAAGTALAKAVRVRADITNWLFSERLPDWDIACVVISELHSVIEPMWHGVDATHPLHGLPSGPAAKDGIHAVYRAVDDMIGELRAKFADATFLAFCMHGMGPNNADVASMLLLPEFCFRRSFKEALFEPQASWITPYLQDGTAPILAPGRSWEGNVKRCMKGSLKGRMERRAGQLWGKLARHLTFEGAKGEHSGDSPLSWMPAMSYAPWWPEMDAFAIPSFYDGRIRINLKGRESDGRVDIGDYDRFCEALIEELRALKDPRSGLPVVQDVKRQRAGDAVSLDDTKPDIQIIWAPHVVLAFQSAEHGLIGPAPVRRTGGHTGGNGVLYIANGPLPAGPLGKRSAFDVAPTIASLLGMELASISGESLLPAATAPRAAL